MKLDTRIFPDIDALSRAALEQLLSDLRASIAQRGRGAIALSGGHTPEKMYALWAATEKYRNETDWNRVHLFWGDERYVPQDDPLSNYRMTSEALLAQVPIPAANVHAAPTNLPTPEKAAEVYDQELRKFFGAAAPAFDVTLLGLGPEGHTASLFPDSPALLEKSRWVVPVQVAALPPVSSLFAALLGVNPVRHLLTPSGALSKLSTANQHILTGREFFPDLISGPFHHGLVVVFAVAAALAALAALASLLRGGRTVPSAAAGESPRPTTEAGPARDGWRSRLS